MEQQAQHLGPSSPSFDWVSASLDRVQSYDLNAVSELFQGITEARTSSFLNYVRIEEYSELLSDFDSIQVLRQKERAASLDHSLTAQQLFSEPPAVVFDSHLEGDSYL